MGLFGRKVKYELRSGDGCWRLTESGREIAASRRRMSRKQAEKWARGHLKDAAPAAAGLADKPFEWSSREQPSPQARSVNARAQRLGL